VFSGASANYAGVVIVTLHDSREIMSAATATAVRVVLYFTRAAIFLRNNAMFGGRPVHSGREFGNFSGRRFDRRVSGAGTRWIASLFEKQYSGLSPLWRSTRRTKEADERAEGEGEGEGEWGGGVGRPPARGKGTRGALFLKFA